MIFVLGIDAATWKVITPNLDKLQSFKRLCSLGKAKELILEERPISASIWCGMFCGKTVAEHRHESYVVDGNLVKREDIKSDFIWDILSRENKKAKALNVPFVIPPYSFGVDFKPVGFGLPTNEREWQDELEMVTEKTKDLLKQELDLLVTVYTLLDRIQHFYWGEDCVVEWYKRLDAKIGELLFDSDFLISGHNKLIVISDHGFCSFGETKIQTLPHIAEQGVIKGDHDEHAMLITINLAYEINRPQDVFLAIMKEAGVSKI